MAQRRPRHARRNALVFLGSFLAHALLFFFAARELMIPYRLPMPTEPAIQADLIPPEPIPIVPPPPPIPVPKPTPVPPKPQPTPAPQPQPQPQPAQATPAPPQPAPKMVVRPTAPAKVATEHPTLQPTEKPVTVVSPFAAPLIAPQPGPPQEQPHAAVVAEQPHVVSASRNQKQLRRNNENTTALAPPGSVPSFLPGSPTPPGGASASGGPGAAAPGGGGAGGFPGGSLPSGFGSGLRGSLLGCIDASVAKLTPEEQARCASRLGADAKDAPAMDPIGATARGELDTEAQQEDAAKKYRDEQPTGPVDHTIAGQPRLGHKPGGP